MKQNRIAYNRIELDIIYYDRLDENRYEQKIEK